jgi:hypothetical protein
MTETRSMSDLQQRILRYIDGLPPDSWGTADKAIAQEPYRHWRPKLRDRSFCASVSRALHRLEARGFVITGNNISRGGRTTMVRLTERGRQWLTKNNSVDVNHMSMEEPAA